MFPPTEASQLVDGGVTAVRKSVNPVWKHSLEIHSAFIRTLLGSAGFPFSFIYLSFIHIVSYMEVRSDMSVLLCEVLPQAARASNQWTRSVLCRSTCRVTSFPPVQNVATEQREDEPTRLLMGYWRDHGSLMEGGLSGMMALCFWEYFVKLEGKNENITLIPWTNQHKRGNR